MNLNSPQIVNKGGSTIRYVYDATGRKLAQHVTSGASQKRTDYAGEFVYEDHALQFINHEEGRIVMAKTKLMYTNSFDAVTADMETINTGLGTYVNKGEKYIIATSSNASPGNGVFPIGVPIKNVGVNERYRVRVKAYAGGTSPAYLQTLVKSGAAVVSSLTALIPQGSVSESWIELVVKAPATGANLTLEAGLVWNTVRAGETRLPQRVRDHQAGDYGAGVSISFEGSPGEREADVYDQRGGGNEQGHHGRSRGQ